MKFDKPTRDQLSNRFRHHAPFGDQVERYTRIREQIFATATVCVELTPCSPEQTRALNALDEAMMLFNAAIARNEQPPVAPAPEPKVVPTALTTNRGDPGLKKIRPDGQQETYLVLSEEDRAKGFVRPVRRSYKHVGTAGPRHPLRDLTEKEKEHYAGCGYVKFETYPAGETAFGRYWTQADLDAVGKGCGQVTTMGQAIAETYARKPGFYGATFCCGCGKHLPVGEDGEFVWVPDGGRVGT